MASISPQVTSYTVSQTVSLQNNHHRKPAMIKPWPSLKSLGHVETPHWALELGRAPSLALTYTSCLHAPLRQQKPPPGPGPQHPLNIHSHRNMGVGKAATFQGQC